MTANTGSLALLQRIAMAVGSMALAGLLASLSGVGALAAGLQHTCALRSNGQLRQGDNIPRTTPTDVPGGAVWALP